MSQQFKSKYEQMRENSQSVDHESQTPDLTDNSPIRNICFVLEDGSMTFLNYGYLISGSIDAACEKLIMSYTTCEVELIGVKLNDLFLELCKHEIRFVKAFGTRYMALKDNELNMVAKISIQAKQP